MFILNPPYISELLKDTIKKNGYYAVKNKMSEQLGDYSGILDTQQAIKEAKKSKNFKLYSNSEDSIEWIVNNLDFTSIPEKINLFKDKVKFRDMIKDIYPNFYYREVTINELKNLDKRTLKYPFILKPAVGFLSFGVYPLRNEDDFDNVVLNIEKDINNFKDFFPIEVVDASRFIMEEMIEGEEYAIDAYFNEAGEAVILNIFYHPFFDEKDVSDRVYYSSKDIILSNEKQFKELLDKIGKAADLKNFPMHIEIRQNEQGIIPIEVNPMRFAGWCDTDLAYYAYGINIYEYYMENKKPNWNDILKNKGDELYYFTAAEVPAGIKKEQIKSFNYEEYLKNIKQPLDIRKFNYKEKPLFAFVFGKTNDKNEIKTLLGLNMSKYIEI